MKQLFTYLLLILGLTNAFAQEASEDPYYAPEIDHIPVLQKPNPQYVKQQFDNMPVKSRLYIGIEGVGRANQTQIDHNYEYMLIEARRLNIGYGAKFGWIYREQLAIEGGYARTPIYNYIKLNTTNDGAFKVKNQANAFIVRAKAHVELEKRGIRRNGLWFGVGLWAVPGSNKTRPNSGYQIIHHDPYGQQSDTTYILRKTTINPNWTFAVEGNAEYAFKISEWLDATVFLRFQKGFKSAITSSLTYSNNQKELHKSELTSTGTGVTFGLAVRFVNMIRYGEKSKKDKWERISTPASNINK